MKWVDFYGARFGERRFFNMSPLFLSFSSLFLALFRLLYTAFLRFISGESSEMKSPDYDVIPKEDDEMESVNRVEKQVTIANVDESSSDAKGLGLEETWSKKDESFGFTFKFPSYDEFRSCQIEKSDSNLSSFITEEEELTSLILNKREFQSPSNVSVFVEESEPSSFSMAAQSEFLSEKDFGKEEKPEFHDNSSSSDSDSDEATDMAAQSEFLSDKDFGDEEKPEFHDEPSSSESDTDSETSSREFSFMSHDFLSDTDFEASVRVKSVDEEALELELRDLEGKTESSSSSSPPCESEDSSALESLWEHQELVEQLKMELKKVRATGLPTIMEDSESPKISTDLRPWKIDENLRRRGDKLGELHRFFKSYKERMRKFDILNYQKMYALGLLQSKDPLHTLSSSDGKPSMMIWGRNRKKPRSSSTADPMASFVAELRADLEMVYVGQLCLSWEFLQWQYEKAFDIWESDPHGFRRYNEVAGEFQQFQVLLHRFVENEPFQGPRVESYVKNRCVVRNLLQVPVIREDSKEGKKARRGSDLDAITSDALFDILEESIRTIWRFIRADKSANAIVQKRRSRGKEAELLQDPADSELLEQVRHELQQKDKKLKEILRCGNCILTRLRRNAKKSEEDGSESEHIKFFSQVDMRLVARVLKMPRITTDQLVWCHSKLTNISFVNRKIRVEPSFLLFPC